MDSKRQLKVGRLLQKELSSIFVTDIKSIFEGAFITVTQVKVTSDLSVAKVYLSLMLAPNKEILLENIKQKTKNIRQLLSNKIKSQIRIVPELQFYIDDSAEYAAKINSVLSNLNIPPKESSQD